MVEVRRDQESRGDGRGMGRGEVVRGEMVLRGEVGGGEKEW